MVVLRWNAVAKGSTMKATSREVWELLRRSGHFTWQCLVVAPCGPMRRSTAMVSIRHTFPGHPPSCISWIIAGLRCMASTLCYSLRPSPPHPDHFSPCAILNPPPFSFISGVVPPPPEFQLPPLLSLPKASDLHPSVFSPALALVPSISVPILVQEA